MILKRFINFSSLETFKKGLKEFDLKEYIKIAENAKKSYQLTNDIK